MASRICSTYCARTLPLSRSGSGATQSTTSTRRAGPLHRRRPAAASAGARPPPRRRRPRRRVTMTMIIRRRRRRRRSAFEARLALVSEMASSSPRLRSWLNAKRQRAAGPFAPELLLVHQLMVQDSGGLAISRSLHHSTAAGVGGAVALAVVVVARNQPPHARPAASSRLAPRCRRPNRGRLHPHRCIRAPRCTTSARAGRGPPAPPLQLQRRVDVRQVAARAVPPVGSGESGGGEAVPPRWRQPPAPRRCEGSAAGHEARPYMVVVVVVESSVVESQKLAN